MREPHLTWWLVRCADHTSGHKTREAAEARKAQVERLGACRLEHEIIPPEGAEPQKILEKD